MLIYAVVPAASGSSSRTRDVHTGAVSHEMQLKIRRARPVLMAYSSSIVHFDDVGERDRMEEAEMLMTSRLSASRVARVKDEEARLTRPANLTQYT